MNRFWIYYSSILLAIILTTIVLYCARPIFMPLALAGMLALVFKRFCDRLERRRAPILVTAVLCGLLFTGVVAGVVLLINWYIHRFAADDQLQKHIGEVVGQAREFLKDQWGLNIRG